MPANNLLELSYIIPVYLENSSSPDLDKLLQRYGNYPRELTDKIQFILVDDCSPVEPVIPASHLNILLVRINENIPWNQGGARNLGVMLSKTAKLLLTDLDHSFSAGLLEKLLHSSLPNHLYKFKRRREGVKVRSHPNTFFCSKAVFYKALGYDEDFSGHYGYDDVFYVELQKALGTKLRYFSWSSYVDHLEHQTENKDDLQHFLVRDTSYNKALLDEKLSIIKAGKPFKAHSRRMLDFTYSIRK
ncbi:MAG: glycosyltransferase family 2 protein [Rhizobacter sp.]|nr:glycosyltransferase family 2 protein [Ferruginibacter sp.]